MRKTDSAMMLQDACLAIWKINPLEDGHLVNVMWVNWGYFITQNPFFGLATGLHLQSAKEKRRLRKCENAKMRKCENADDPYFLGCDLSAFARISLFMRTILILGPAPLMLRVRFIEADTSHLTCVQLSMVCPCDCRQGHIHHFSGRTQNKRWTEIIVLYVEFKTGICQPSP